MLDGAGFLAERAWVRARRGVQGLECFALVEHV